MSKEAEDSLLLWQRSLRQKPNFDTEMDSSVQDFSAGGDRTLREKKRMEVKIAQNKWEKAIGHHLKNAIERFFSVLKFTNGWLVDCVTDTNEAEFNSVKAVRRILLPKVLLLFHLVFILRNMFTKLSFNVRWCLFSSNLLLSKIQSEPCGTLSIPNNLEIY